MRSPPTLKVRFEERCSFSALSPLLAEGTPWTSRGTLAPNGAASRMSGRFGYGPTADQASILWPFVSRKILMVPWTHSLGAGG